MGRLVKWIDRRFYPKFQSNWDDHLFRQRILSHLKPEKTILDLGAGAGIVEQMNFKGRASTICGVDLDPRVLDNPMLDEGRISDLASIPYNDATFDLVFSDNVLEHVAQPEKVFREVARVLKPGGLFLFKTPNKWHYMPLIARITPQSFHRVVNRWRGRIAEDVFPTLYRANSKRRVSQLSHAAGLNVLSIELIEGRPEYLRINGPTYLAGLTYERLVNSHSIFEIFRILLIGTLCKISP